MKLTKRQFLKLSLGGTAACALAPLFKPASLIASPLVTPGSYLDSTVHAYWMRLSYNGGAESREVRRTVGAALRNIGAIKGKGDGYDFTLCFDRAVDAAFARWADTRQKPNTLFGLIQVLYNNHIEPEFGPDGGRAMFGTLLGILRGWDGSANGAETHQAYLSYRDAALAYKDEARTGQDPALVAQLRQNRRDALEQWRSLFLAQVDRYATRQAQLDPQFTLNTSMLNGFHVYVRPDAAEAPRLKIGKRGNRVIVDYKGTGQLQEAPGPAGPWSDTRKAPPAAFETVSPVKFFRTINKNGGLQ